MAREIVVAAFEEDLFWLGEIQDRVTLYIKSPSRGDFPDAMRLPNVGREAHTYAWHILARYDTLAEETMFLQGMPLDHMHNRALYFYLHGLEHEGDFCSMGEWFLVNQLGHPLHAWDCDLTEVWRQLFTTPIPQRLTCIRGAQFIVSRDLIRARSIDFWNAVITIAANHKHGPWILECLWYYIFDPRYHAAL